MGSIVSKSKKQKSDKNIKESKSSENELHNEEEITPGNPDEYHQDNSAASDDASERVASRPQRPPANREAAPFLSPSKQPTLESVPLMPLSKDDPTETLMHSNTLVSEYFNPLIWKQYKRRRDSGGFGMDLLLNVAWQEAVNSTEQQQLDMDLKSQGISSLEVYDCKNNGIVTPSSECFDEFGEGFLYQIIERIHHPFEICVSKSSATDGSLLAGTVSFEGSSVHDMDSSWDSSELHNLILPLECDEFLVDWSSVIQEAAPCHDSSDATNDCSPTKISSSSSYNSSSSHVYKMTLSRNLADYPFCSGISKAQRTEVKMLLIKHITKALQVLGSSFPAGRFYSVQSLSQQQLDDFISHGLCFSKNETYEAAGFNRDWCHDRVLWIANDRSFAIWINESEHLQLISYTSLHNVSSGFDRIAALIQLLEKEVSFATHEVLGYLTGSLSKLGSGMCSSLALRLPLCSQHKNFGRFLHENHVRAIEYDQENHIFLLSHARSLGDGALQCNLYLIRAISKLIEWERELQSQNEGEEMQVGDAEHKQNPLELSQTQIQDVEDIGEDEQLGSIKSGSSHIRNGRDEALEEIPIMDAVDD